MYRLVKCVRLIPKWPIKPRPGFTLGNSPHPHSPSRSRDDFAPTADEAQLERATKQLLARWTVKEPAGVERPTRVEITQPTFVRDPRARAWVLATAKGYCEACASQDYLNDAPIYVGRGVQGDRELLVTRNDVHFRRLQNMEDWQRCYASSWPLICVRLTPACWKRA
jgi:hypothetical protein